MKTVTIWNYKDSAGHTTDYLGNITEITKEILRKRKHKGNTKEIQRQHNGNTNEILRQLRGNTREVRGQYSGNTKGHTQEILRKYQGQI